MIPASGSLPVPGGLGVALPRFATVRRIFDAPRIDDVAGAVARQFASAEVRARFAPGEEIAVGCGSRGVTDAAIVTRVVVAELVALGCRPFLFPAMGSHGAATAEGQVEVLRGYGISEETMGCPVRSSMDTVVVGRLDDGTPVHMDAHAAGADGVVLINRIKPHTNFRAPVESGIVKMLGLGMGKIAGATALHRHGMDRFGEVLPAAARVVLGTGRFRAGVGIVENALDQTAVVEVMVGDRLMERETALQALAKTLLGRLPFDDIDVLVIDEIGKDVSGSGADPNVTGRNVRGVAWEARPAVQKIVLLSLTAASHGNAVGVGQADVITRRLFDAIDLRATYANSITSGALDGSAIPMVLDTDRDAVAIAVRTCARVAAADARIVRIRNTLDLGVLQVSEALLPEVAAREDLAVLRPPEEVSFDAEGRWPALPVPDDGPSTASRQFPPPTP